MGTVSIPSKLLSVFINLYRGDIERIEDPLYSVELVHRKLHRFFRRRPTLDDIESIGIIPDGTSEAIFFHEMDSRLNRLQNGSYEPRSDADSQNGRRSSLDMLDQIDDVDPSTYMKRTHSDLERELKDLRETSERKTAVIDSLKVQHNEMEERMMEIREREQKHLDRIQKLEHEMIDEEENLEKVKARQSIQMRQSIKKETELEMECANVQIQNEHLSKGNAKSRKHMLRIRKKGDRLEKEWEVMVDEKMKILQQTNDQIDQLRAYLRRSQEAYAHHRSPHYIPPLNADSAVSGDTELIKGHDTHHVL